MYEVFRMISCRIFCVELCPVDSVCSLLKFYEMERYYSAFSDVLHFAYPPPSPGMMKFEEKKID